MFAISKFVEIFKYNILKQKKLYILYTNIKFLYGWANLKKRFKFLYFFIAPSYKRKYFFKKKQVLLLYKKNKVFFRFQKFSKASFSYLIFLQGFSLFYKSYNAFLEVNYNVHIILLQNNVTIFNISYPFGIQKNILYRYFKTRKYF